MPWIKVTAIVERGGERLEAPMLINADHIIGIVEDRRGTALYLNDVSELKNPVVAKEKLDWFEKKVG
jgi:hypothetical protein